MRPGRPWTADRSAAPIPFAQHLHLRPVFVSEPNSELRTFLLRRLVLAIAANGSVVWGLGRTKSTALRVMGEVDRGKKSYSGYLPLSVGEERVCSIADGVWVPAQQRLAGDAPSGNIAVSCSCSAKGGEADESSQKTKLLRQVIGANSAVYC